MSQISTTALSPVLQKRKLRLRISRLLKVIELCAGAIKMCNLVLIFLLSTDLGFYLYIILPFGGEALLN